MVFRKHDPISRPLIGGVVLFILFALIGMKHERNLAMASQLDRVNIEVLPREASKFIDATARSFVPVAILSSLNFDAATVNPASVRLAGAPITKGKKGQLRGHLTDVNGDGRVDMVVYVSVYSLDLDPGISDALLTATTFDGKSVSGSQQVSFRGPVVPALPDTVSAMSGGFSNSALIKIRNDDPPPTRATPDYPSTINGVANQPTITKLTISIFGYWHTFPDDVDILLVGPTGAKCLLMADCGGANFITAASPVNLTFNDSGPSLPDNDQEITSGTYKPTKGTCTGVSNNCVPTDFPSPAPAGPYATTLSVFNGTNPNGTWQLYVIDDTDGDEGKITGGWGLTINPPSKGTFDFDGDGKTDFAVWRPSEGNWYILNSSTGTSQLRTWGVSSDQIVPGDYDGDGKTDVAVWRPSEGNWYIINSSTGAGTVRQWGVSTDIPVPGDYDGDGKTDIAVWRPTEGNWYIINSSTGVGTIRTWGMTNDKPVPGDYNGDGKTDFAVWRPSDGGWYVTFNSPSGGGVFRQWGVSTDVPVPGDYDGDGKADFAVWRPAEGNWYVAFNSPTSGGILRQWGVSTDVPVPGDYDGDGKTDFAVWRPSEGNWYVAFNTPAGGGTLRMWGINADKPVPSAFIR